MSAWINVEDQKPDGDVLVFMESGKRPIQTASYHKNIVIIGNMFEFDMPKVTHWMPLPEPPEDM